MPGATVTAAPWAPSPDSLDPNLMPFRHTLLVLFAPLLLAPFAFAQEAGDPLPFQTPPAELAALVDAPLAPAVSMSPDRAWLLLIERPAAPGLIELAQPELGLGGLRINPVTNGPSRSQTFRRLTLLSIGGTSGEVEIAGIPEDARIRNIQWSPDAQRIAFTLDEDARIVLYVADVASAQAHQVSDRPLVNVTGTPFTWLPDGSLIARVVPSDRGAAPAGPQVPVGPSIQESSGIAAPARTFQDLLANPHDEDLFEHYLDTELVRIDAGGAETSLGIRGLITSVSRSPGGEYLLVQRTHRPFSYLVPQNRFPNLVSIHDASTGSLVKTVAELPLAETVPTGFGSVPTGPRSFTWRNDAPATLVWVEALDEGDIRAEADRRDRVLMLDAPFTREPTTLMETELRYAGINWTDAGFALLHEFFWQTRTRRTYEVNPDDPTQAPRLVFDLSTEDRYNDPGNPLTRPDPTTGYSLVVTTDGGRTIFLTGAGASPEGNRPFLRKASIDSGEIEEIFRSESPHYEIPIELLDEERGLLITRRETPVDPPNYFLLDLQSGQHTALTSFPHPYPDLAEVQREAIEYERADGVSLSAILYLPAGYDAERDGPLPALIWAYPREFRSADAAGQRTDSPYQFTHVSVSGAVPYVTRGFAVLNNTAMPIVGEGDDEPNDTFVEQLVANAQAAIDEGVRRGVVDPSRVAVGGHSYGAFMAANLIAHSDLFRAAIARSGAYNRTLTPFGFQAEERTYWEAPEVYYTMSPFMQAHRINQPVLLIHGEADNNSGTFPMQSERLFAAINGHGGTARLVILPHESHGYRSRESLLHVLWETDRWLEQYVARPAQAASGTGARDGM
jgi:dipeptidyl aminopeptidase/acylaminoacyl peptidase